MIFGYLTLATALIISLISAFYSVSGLTAIFAAAFWPIVIMGSALEIGKIVTTLWLHKYWDRAEIQYKLYLCSAVAALMFLTSIGIFGGLSKAHSDQALVSGDVTSKLEIYDEKIKTAKENIEADRKQLKQMDEAVDQVMARSTTEGGADKSNAIRKSQARDRASLAKDIETNQKTISQLNDQAAPIRAEVRKVEADVGPIKYIAALIYGDNPDANLLEHAVRWVIILIVAVFDPLALTLLLAATKTFEWERGINLFNIKQDDEFTEEEIQELNDLNPIKSEPEGDEPIFEKIEIPLQVPEFDYVVEDADDEVVTEEVPPEPKLSTDPHPVGWMFATELHPSAIKEEDIEPYGDDVHQHAMNIWKHKNPGKTFKEQFDLLDAGKISELPWEHEDHVTALNLSDRELLNLKLGLSADNDPTSGEVQGFGTKFPETPVKGDMYLRVDYLPSQLYKFNGTQWIRVNKNLSDSYIYDDAYINHLIEKIGSGEYDPDLLNDIERERIAEKLKTNNLG
jgi:hypothetical protein